MSSPNNLLTLPHIERMDLAVIEREMVKFTPELGLSLEVLASDMLLAIECVEIFGGIPRPVAEAIVRNIDPIVAAIDQALCGEVEPSR